MDSLDSGNMIESRLTVILRNYHSMQKKFDKYTQSSITILKQNLENYNQFYQGTIEPGLPYDTQTE